MFVVPLCDLMVKLYEGVYLQNNNLVATYPSFPKHIILKHTYIFVFKRKNTVDMSLLAIA